MDNKISTKAKAELIGVLGHRYRESSKMAKTQILDEFIAVSGYHRKHAIRLLSCKTDNGIKRNNSCQVSHGRRIYDEAIKEALIVIWEAADRICGKRLKAILSDLVEAMERYGHLNLDPEV